MICLALCFLNSFFLAIPDSDGWVPIEQPVAVEDEIEEEGGRGVLFSLSIGEGRFWVRFPSEPSYIYTKDGVEVIASSDVAIFQLHVMSHGGADLASLFAIEKNALIGVDILEEKLDLERGQFHIAYLFEGQWHAKDYVSTSHALYVFHTCSSSQPQDLQHEAFVSSLQKFKQK
ncbi:MAG TPA: hypothetical protein VJK48_04570 [Chlamydiales bacterium]|nr:hypothetical protein [Chlamydiales bacterium]